jgi:hypothetical protein
VTEPERPILRIVSGSPSPEELAALTAIVAAASGSGDAPAPVARRGGWSDPSRQHRSLLAPGPNGWRSAGW